MTALLFDASVIRVSIKCTVIATPGFSIPDRSRLRAGALRAHHALNMHRRNSPAKRVKMAKVRFQHFGEFLAPYPRAVRVSDAALIDCSTAEAAFSCGG